VVAEKYRIILFGRYPFEEQWRPLLATGLLLACWSPAACGLLEALAGRVVDRGAGRLLCADVRQHHGPEKGRDRPLGRSATDHHAGLAVDDHGLPDRHGGGAGRRSKLPAIRTFCTIYVELIRGVPLISVLFMASFMFPLFMPQGLSIDVLIRVMVGYHAVCRCLHGRGHPRRPAGHPQGADRGSRHAGPVLLADPAYKIVLPQALAMVVPSIMNNFISLFKDTSLVTIVSLYELTGALSWH
jgi:general L-amino acid transport system permease protein